MAADILVVDDEADIREIVAGILEDEGHGTRTAQRQRQRAGGDRRRARPSLVFLDIWLQGSRLDGLALLDEIKRQHPDLPVVMISGHGNIETAVSAIKRGAYDYIEKPFKADRLVLVAERALEASKLQARGRRAASSAPASRDELIGTSGGDEPSAPDDRARRADQQPRHDLRPVRLRQGAGGARRSTRRSHARRRPVRRAQRRGDHARPHGDRAVRHRAAQRRGAARRRARGGARRHALSRRDRRHAARDAEQDPARARRPDLRAGRRLDQACQGRRARPLLDRARSRERDRRRAASARICSTG